MIFGESFNLLPHQHIRLVESHKSQTQNRPRHHQRPQIIPDSRSQQTARTEDSSCDQPPEPQLRRHLGMAIICGLCYEGGLVSVLEISFWTSAAISSDVLRTVTLHNCFFKVKV